MDGRGQTIGRPLLALETSGRAMAAALWGPQGLIAEKRAVTGARHGVALAPITVELLKSRRLNVKDLAAIAVSLGPGSWTGLRIGLATAKSMAWAAGISLVGVPSLEALALAASREKPVQEAPGAPAFSAPKTIQVLALRHAYSEGLYGALFEIHETLTTTRRLLPESVMRPEELPGLLAGVPGQSPMKAGTAQDPRRLVCGDAQCLDVLGADLTALGWQVLEGFDEIPGAVLAECAWHRAQRGELWGAAEEIHAAAPLYLRKSDPELKLARKARPSCLT